MTNSGLILDDVTISLNREPLLSVCTTVAPGTVTTVMGPSGCGKSTLLAYATGVLDPVFKARGRVLLDGRDVTSLPPEERRFGLLFQDALLFPHLSVGGNLSFALPASIKGKANRRARIEKALSQAELTDFAERDPATLSGGQKARVALVRTLLSDPRALLLDEPFSKLDAGLRAQVRDWVFGTARDAGLPVLLVTHDPADAEAAGGTVLRIGEADGRGD